MRTFVDGEIFLTDKYFYGGVVVNKPECYIDEFDKYLGGRKLDSIEDLSELNRILYEELNINDTSPIVVSDRLVDKNGRIVCRKPNFQLLKPNDNNMYQAFNGDVWKNLKLSEKYRVVRWVMDKLMNSHSESFKYKTKLSVIGSRLTPYMSAYCDHGGNIICIKPELFLMKSGLIVLSTIEHEMQHAIDYRFIDEHLVGKIYQTFFGRSQLGDFNAYTNLMMLPISGVFTNPKTGEKITIDEKLQNELLLCKNSRVPFQVYNGKINKHSDIKNQSNFNEYVKNSLYFISELETRAYVTGSDSLENIMPLIKKEYSLTDSDNLEISRTKSLKNYVLGRKNNLEHIFGKPYAEIMDTALKYEYVRNQRAMYHNASYGISDELTKETYDKYKELMRYGYEVGIKGLEYDRNKHYESEK